MKNRRLWIIGGLLIVLTLLSLVFLRNSRKRFDWSEKYAISSKQPYGTHIIKTLLQGYFPDKGFEVLRDSLHRQLHLDSLETANYVFIGEALYLDSLNTEALIHFVERGNNAFIAANDISQRLMEQIYDGECEDEVWTDYRTIRDSLVPLSLRDTTLQAPGTYFTCRFVRRNLPEFYFWSYIEPNLFCEAPFSITALGYLRKRLVNFAKIEYGDGTFYLHTVPLAFTNYHIVTEAGLQYANGVFSYLPTGKIYWDEFSKTETRLEALNQARNRQISSESPLQYILSQPPLAWAWYLLLSIGLLFLLFRTRRRQRIIPVLESNANTSLEFVATIGRLYFLQNSHKKLALQKMKLFQAFVRERYHLRGHDLDEDFIGKLAAKSEVPRSLIDKILLMHRNISNSTLVTENTLIDFHRLMAEFYAGCK
ncbi:MAG TPA: hypothetical protein PKC76_05350 [Saprospiraceae bacterium]|nr:hypothetical protein [Saprospiraceae bacterium]HMP23535.1 hypothetical protein [Saprospiraceae bacterium]